MVILILMGTIDKMKCTVTDGRGIVATFLLHHEIAGKHKSCLIPVKAKMMLRFRCVLQHVGNLSLRNAASSRYIDGLDRFLCLTHDLIAGHSVIGTLKPHHLFCLFQGLTRQVSNPEAIRRVCTQCHAFIGSSILTGLSSLLHADDLIKARLLVRKTERVMNLAVLPLIVGCKHEMIGESNLCQHINASLSEIRIELDGVRLVLPIKFNGIEMTEIERLSVETFHNLGTALLHWLVEYRTADIIDEFVKVHAWLVLGEIVRKGLDKRQKIVVLLLRRTAAHA